MPENSFSKKLQDLGFSKHPDSRRATGDKYHGQFQRDNFQGPERTVAIDENGRVWVMSGQHMDLTSQGFEDAEAS